MRFKYFKIGISILLTGAAIFIGCRKKDTITALESTPVAGSGSVDVSWTLDKPHCNVNWESRYLDWSNGMLTGRFNNFGFNPKFSFDGSDLSKCSINAWVQLSSVDSGEPQRDAIGKCIRSYMGITYLDSMKTQTNPQTDSAWFNSTRVVRSGTGYVVFGNLRFNKYRAPSGYPDMTPIVKPAMMFLVYNGTSDFDTDGDNVTDRLRASFSAKLTFKRSDHMDTKSTIQWVPVPAITDQVGNTIAANNKTYGVWTTNIADEMNFSFNVQFYKNH